MDISIVITAAGTVVSFAGIMYAFFRNFRIDNEKKFDEIKQEIRSFRCETQGEFKLMYAESGFNRHEDKEDNLKYRDQVNHMYDKFFSRFDHSDGEIKEIRTSVNRLEGAFYSQDCCMLKGEKKPKKTAVKGDNNG